MHAWVRRFNCTTPGGILVEVGHGPEACRRFQIEPAGRPMPCSIEAAAANPQLKGISVSDPYNTYVDHVPAVSQAAVRPVPAVAAKSAPKPVDLITRLDVSDSWKRKFRLIEKAGGPTFPNARELSFGERRAIGFNFLAFFFGPFYFLAKGLWRPALAYTLLAIAVGVTLDLVSKGKLAHGLGYGFAAVYAMRANVTYYRKVVLGETPWF